MTTIDELEARVRALESEVTGEKAVTRYAITQANLGANDIAAIRTDVRQLTQDVTLLRQEATVLRRGQEETNMRIDRLEGRIDRLEGRSTPSLPPSRRAEADGPQGRDHPRDHQPALAIRRRTAGRGGARRREQRGDVGPAETLGGAPHPLPHFRNDRQYVVFHFKTDADAAAFAARFDGKLLPVRAPRSGRSRQR